MVLPQTPHYYFQGFNMIKRTTLLICGFFLLWPTLASAQDAFFDGGGDGATWEDANNWSTGALPTANANITDTFVVSLSSNQTINELDVVGDITDGTATLNHSAGAVTAAGWAKIGVNPGNTGTYNLSGTATSSGNDELHVGDNGTGTFNASGTTTFTVAGNTQIGTGDGTGNGNGTFSLSDNALYSGGQFNVGNDGTATLNVADSAVLNFENANFTNNGGTATVNITGGSVNANSWVAIGLSPTGSATFNHSGGSLTSGLVNGEFITVGENGPATYNASGTATINSPGILVGRNVGGDGLLELTGSNVTVNLGSLTIGLDSDIVDVGALGEISWIADAGGVSTIVSADSTGFGANATLSVDLTADAAFSTFTTTPTGSLVDVAVLVDNVNAPSGTFAGLAEGATVNIGGGMTASISYAGGDGSDIVLQTFVTGGSPVLKGDVDLSGVVDFSDIAPFIAVLQSGIFQAEADADCSTVVDFADIGPFIAIIQAQ